ncbi:uncharacterized protein METZ01_LOCUS501609, partial [marine metagenome]
ELIGNRLEAKDLMVSSKNEIPHSYIERELKFSPIESFLKKYRESSGFMTSLALIIKSTGESLLNNDYFNSYRDKSKIKIYSDINIGVVIDLDGKLAVPIIKNVPGKNIDSIVIELLEMRRGLMQNKLDVNNLLGGTFTVSALDHTTVSRFYPIIHPKQSAVLSFPAPVDKLFMNEKNKIVLEKVVNLGLSFDHSYLNASKGIYFLDTICLEMKKIIK